MEQTAGNPVLSRVNAPPSKVIGRSSTTEGSADKKLCQVESPLRYFVESADPEPSRAVEKVPVVIFAVSSAGISAAANTRKDGVPVEPLGAAKTLLVV